MTDTGDTPPAACESIRLDGGMWICEKDAGHDGNHESCFNERVTRWSDA